MTSAEEATRNRGASLFLLFSFANAIKSAHRSDPRANHAQIAAACDASRNHQRAHQRVLSRCLVILRSKKSLALPAISFCVVPCRCRRIGCDQLKNEQPVTLRGHATVIDSLKVAAQVADTDNRTNYRIATTVLRQCTRHRCPHLPSLDRQSTAIGVDYWQILCLTCIAVLTSTSIDQNRARVPPQAALFSDDEGPALCIE